MYEHSLLARPLLPHQYTDTGEIIEGVPQIIPMDGWYWLQTGHGAQVIWTMCCVSGEYVLLLDAVWHWTEPEFHARHKIGPPVEYPRADNSKEMLLATALDFQVQVSLDGTDDEDDVELEDL